jgi:D-glycero-alpha-D-manno-heptose-7-phosphate kinase
MENVSTQMNWKRKRGFGVIISKVPLRITFNGGGSDLPKFFMLERGLCTTATINKFVFVTVNYSFDGKYRIAYSEVEHVNMISEIQHPLVRNTLQLMGWTGSGLEITSVAEVPATGTGLGSSSAFTVALVGAIAALQGKSLTDTECAQIATDIEIRLTGDPIGWQDQFAVSNGGLVQQLYSPEGVTIQNIFKSEIDTNRFLDELNRKSLFFHIDKKRKANEILKKQNALLDDDLEGRILTRQLVSLAEKSVLAINNFDFVSLGNLLLQGWETKFRLNGDSQDEELVTLFNRVKSSSAHGGKLMGAGGGGFLFIIAESSFHKELISLFSEYKHYNFRIQGNSREIYHLGGTE